MAKIVSDSIQHLDRFFDQDRKILSISTASRDGWWSIDDANRECLWSTTTFSNAELELGARFDGCDTFWKCRGSKVDIFAFIR